MSSEISVVAGVIFDCDKQQVLLSLRKPEQHQGDCWEFPGGKQEAEESQPDALIRELEEELGITPTEFEPLESLTHSYPEKTVVLHFWCVTKFTGKAFGREQQRIRWVSIKQLGELSFPPANQPIVDYLQAL